MKINILEQIEAILDAFKDMGKLLPSELQKGQKLDPKDETNFNQVDGRIFFNAIKKIRINDIAKLNKGLPDKGLKSLSVYNAGEYKNMKCYLGKNNSSGYAIAHAIELVSVFSSQKSSGHAIVISAVKNGAKKLDCFAFRIKGKISGPLYSLYSKYEFKIDKNLNIGIPGKAYSIINGVSDFVNDKEEPEPENEIVVVFMKR